MMNSRFLPFLFCLLLAGFSLRAQLTFVPGGLPQPTIEAALPGEGLTITSVKYKGSDATFARIKAPEGLPLFTDALIISTGRATDAAGPNDNTQTSTALGVGGDYRTDDVSGTRTFDATLINITFVPDLDSVTISFIFASEEYNESVNNTFNDLFLLEASGPYLGQGINLGALPGRGNGRIPVGVKSVNVGENRDFYVDNNPYKLNGTRDAALEQKLNAKLLKTIEFDGLTKVIRTGMRVKPGAEYNLRIVVADAGDGQFDSALMLESFGFRGLEQHKHEVRRQMIAEQKRQDSIRVADSLALVLQMHIADSLHDADSVAAVLEMQRQDSIARVAEAMANLSKPAEPAQGDTTTRAHSVIGADYKILLQYQPGSVSLTAPQWNELDALAITLMNSPNLRAGIYAPGNPDDAMAAKRLSIVRMYLTASGVPSTRLFENGFSFGDGVTVLPADRVEIWVRER